MKLFNWIKKSKSKNSNVDIDVFFHAFVLDTLNRLPSDRKNTLEKMNLDKVFSTNFDDWKKTIKQVLNLSDTIEIAIKDLWIKNSNIAESEGYELSASEFAKMFIENYYSDDSKIDVWKNENQLTEAKQRISESKYCK